MSFPTATPESLVVDSDRATLRWACRESIPCAVVLPGREFWGRSFMVDLRDGGPRPQLAIAQPQDLNSRAVTRPLRTGDTVRLWSVRQDSPWHLEGFVLGVCVVEGRGPGPVEAALVRLPYRLLATEHQLRPDASPSIPRVRIGVQVGGAEASTASSTLLETWMDEHGRWTSRGDAHIVELSRRTLTFSLPIRSPMVLLPGTHMTVEVTLPDLGLRTRVKGRLVAVMDRGEHMLQGIVLDSPCVGVSDGEHRETLKWAAAVAG